MVNLKKTTCILNCQAIQIFRTSDNLMLEIRALIKYPIKVVNLRKSCHILILFAPLQVNYKKQHNFLQIL